MVGQEWKVDIASIIKIIAVAAAFPLPLMLRITKKQKEWRSFFRVLGSGALYTLTFHWLVWRIIIFFTFESPASKIRLWKQGDRCRVVECQWNLFNSPPHLCNFNFITIIPDFHNTCPTFIKIWLITLKLIKYQYYLLSKYCCVRTRTEVFHSHFSCFGSDCQIILEG